MSASIQSVEVSYGTKPEKTAMFQKEKIEAENHYANFSVQFLAGSLAGISAQTLLHPVDTCKTLAQNGQRITFGFRPLYRGLSGGLVKLGLRGALQQPTMGAWSTLLLAKKDEVDGKAVLPLWKVSLAGVLTGITLVPMTQSCEFLKIQLQTGRSKSLPLLLRDIVASPGVLTRGVSLTTMRNMIGCATYFYTYDKTNRFFNPKSTIGTNKLDSFSSFSRVFLAGASAGLITWAVQLPIDVLKTRVQAQDIHKPAKQISQVAMSLYRKDGFFGLYRGARFVFARSILFNGTNMAFFELYSNILS